MKRKIFSLLMAAGMIIALLIALTACDDKSSAAKPTKLSAPVVTLSDNVATWSADPNADKFEISLDGNLSYVENTVTSKILTEGQTFKIRAVGDGRTYATSDWSSAVTYGTPASTEAVSVKPNEPSEIPDETPSDKLDEKPSEEPTKEPSEESAQEPSEESGEALTEAITEKPAVDTTVTTDAADAPAYAEVVVEEDFWGGELYAEDGKNSAKITLVAYIENDMSAYFDGVEIYDGQTLVLTDDEYEGFSEYFDLHSNTQYTVKIYYSSRDHGYTKRVKEVNITTPAYELPDIDAYGSDNNVVVGKHAIMGFKIEKYIDLQYYDVIVRGYEQNDAYFAGFIVEMLDDPTLLARLEQQSGKENMRPGGYIWEAQHNMDVYMNYWMAWDHKERMDYTDDRWREIAASEEQYVYELSLDNGGLFVADDADIVYNYYAVLRDYFAYDEPRFDIYLRFDLGDGAGVREIYVEHASPYFREVGDDNYGVDIETDENVKNGYVLTEVRDDYRALYVHKLALYKDNEFVCYVPFSSPDVTRVDMEAWLDEWIQKLKCEIPHATEQEMVAKVGAEVIREIFGELQFKVDFGNDIVVDNNGMTGVVGGNKLGNQSEREVLTALSSVDADTLLGLFKAQTGENKTLEAFIAESDNATIISVLNDFRDQVEITSQNAHGIYAAIDGVYDVYDQLERAYESLVREENAAKEITDRIAAIDAISFKFIAGTNLAPAGDYELRVLYRSLFEDYAREDDVKGYGIEYIRIRMDLEAPENIKLEGRRLSWDAVEGADEYVIYVNGEERFTVRDAYYDNYGELQKDDKIRIVATGYYAYDSAPSAEYTFIPPQLARPSVTVSGRNVSWNPIQNASKYVYTVNGQQYETHDTSIYVYESGTVRIKAVDGNGIYLDSEWTSVTVSAGSSDKVK